ncbi:MAG TPA: hypothetical protein VFB07_09145 [Vicinamibacterales bacterium]|nr:hypothetical protein [Vicinamibacterales bacterium]
MTRSGRVIVATAALAALAFVSRLPQLLSPNLLVDGDESVLGLMAKHFAEGRAFPLFFWGQRYGLSTIEAGAAAAAFRIAGVGPAALKVSMLLLWIAGVLFFFRAIAAIAGETLAFWIACALVLNPAWAVWSMKARGGYLTAFTAASMLLWIVVQPRERDTPRRWVAGGILSAVVWLAQPVWLPGVVPIVVWALASRRRLTPAICFGGAMAAMLVAIKLIPVVSSDTWAGPALGNPDVWGTRVRAAQQIYVNLTGSYYLTSTVDPPGPVTPIVAAAWCVAIGLAAVAQAYRLAARRFNRWSHLLFASLAATLVGNWVLLFARDGRYLLPMSALLVALAGLELADLAPKRIARAVAAAALIGGAVSVYEFRNFSYLWPNPPGSQPEAKRLQFVIKSLGASGVRHVFSMNGLLDTQIIFYSDERVISRWSNANDRHPAYVAEVNRALAAGEPVAVVGYTNSSGAPGCWDAPICTGDIEHLVPDPERIYTVDGKYFVYTGAGRALLEKLRFDLPE